MKKLDINSVALTTVILFLICVVVTAALAGTNYITKDRIDSLNKKQEEKAKALVLSASTYEDAEISYEGENYNYFIAKNGEEVLGYVVTVTENGYGGEIKVMVGVDTKGTVTGVNILSADDETPGLGANITKKNFYEQFKGRKKNIVLQKNSADKDKNEIKAVTGATISSTAANKAVNKALSLLENVYTADNSEKEKDGE
ncbi:MAG: RnfABCDGE type electron transport complex subunit G [Ruminococcaceae bacterium]|nr:RnfABCDGE type electron transport complex subunit G [Oscillospiraceae bacterium]